ncbi:MAG: ATP-binding cassette domain-containing protein [Clostridia bacterium]|nr:ATP-binding cassette domain-containing protein [Clostridia bacterium]
MSEFINKEAYDLSLGQKQRITIAGVLAVEPRIIVMDEPTAMLDPEGKEDVAKIVQKLKERGLTIVYITNIIDEIFFADKIVLLEKGKIMNIFERDELENNIDLLKKKGFTVPKVIDVMEKLRDKGIKVELNDIV